MGYNNPEQLFKELTQRVLNDPDISSDYKDYIKGCIALNLDLDSKEKIIKEIIDHYLFVATIKVVERWEEEKTKLYMEGFNELIQKYKKENKERAERFVTKPKTLTHPIQWQPFYDVTPPSNKFIEGLPEDMVDTIETINNAMKQVKYIPSYTQIQKMNEKYTPLNMLKDILNTDTQLVYSVDEGQFKPLSEVRLAYNGRVYPTSVVNEICEHMNENILNYKRSKSIKCEVERNENSDWDTTLTMRIPSKESYVKIDDLAERIKNADITSSWKPITRDYVMEMISDKDIYQQAYHPKMLEVDDLMNKLERHSNSYSKYLEDRATKMDVPIGNRTSRRKRKR